MNEEPRILYIEDEPYRNVHFLERLNTLVGPVEMVQSDGQALELLTQNPNAFDHILLDIMMPSTLLPSSQTKQGLSTGLLLFDNLREKGIIPRIPTTILTNRRNIPVSEYLAKGALRCIIKPVDDEFYSWLNEQLKLKSNGISKAI